MNLTVEALDSTRVVGWLDKIIAARKFVPELTRYVIVQAGRDLAPGSMGTKGVVEYWDRALWPTLNTLGAQATPQHDQMVQMLARQLVVATVSTWNVDSGVGAKLAERVDWAAKVMHQAEKIRGYWTQQQDGNLLVAWWLVQMGAGTEGIAEARRMVVGQCDTYDRQWLSFVPVAVASLLLTWRDSQNIPFGDLDQALGWRLTSTMVWEARKNKVRLKPQSQYLYPSVRERAKNVITGRGRK